MKNHPHPIRPCPLGGFATFAWAGADSLAAATVAAIQAGFSNWTPAHGACRRCVEIFRVAVVRVPLAV